MTPKEKAKELVSKFESHTSTEFDEADEGEYRAIQCALICVEEIIESVVGFEISDKCYTTIQTQYWQQVKTELTTL